MAKIINHLFGDNKKRHREMRSRLVLTSPELIAIKPVTEIKIEDVAEHSQVSQDSFYKCFRSIEDLLNVSAKQAGQELLQPLNAVGATIPDIAMRVATKTRIAMRVIAGIPLLGRLMLKIEWPFSDVQFKGYQDITQDMMMGIEQGCFTDMPPEIAVNLVIGTLRFSIQEMLASPQTQEYENQVIYHLLLSLGVNAKSADQIAQIPFDQLPNLPRRGLVGKILTLVS